MKTYRVTTYDVYTDETKTSEFGADLVRNEGTQTVFYQEGSIIGRVRTDTVTSLEVL